MLVTATLATPRCCRNLLASVLRGGVGADVLCVALPLSLPSWVVKAEKRVMSYHTAGLQENLNAKSRQCAASDAQNMVSGNIATAYVLLLRIARNSVVCSSCDASPQSELLPCQGCLGEWYRMVGTARS